jgi:hypothetical protein
MTEPIDRGAARLLLVLYAANSFLFLVLSFFFLPDPIVKVVGSAAAVVFGLLGLKSLNPREADTISFVTRHRGLVIVPLLLIALFQAALLGLGFAYPCKIQAIPGSTVTVDGKFFARTPDPTPEQRSEAKPYSPDNIRPWLTPQERHYWLRWDTHEIRISKEWYVDKDGSPESVKNVWVNLARLWNPEQAFHNWQIGDLEQKPVFKISYGFKEIEDQPAENLPVADSVRSAVDDWDRLWLQRIGQPELMRYTRADPYIAALQVVQVHQTPQVEFQIRDRAHHTLKALAPITYIESPLDPPMNRIQESVFSQLLDELGIPERFKLSPVETRIETLLSSVSSSVATPEVLPPGEGPPAEGPSATPVPAATVTGSATPTSFSTPTPNPIQIVAQLQTVATDAIGKNQLESAVAVQQQLQATLDKVQTQPPSKQTTELVQHLEGANAVINKAIEEKSRSGRIYIHIASESQREPARKLQAKLVENNQFVVIGIQNVGGRAYIPDTTEVRFFAFPDPPTTKQSADNIVGILRNNGISKVRSSYVIPSARDKRESSDIRTHFEIWFARDSFSAAG